MQKVGDISLSKPFLLTYRYLRSYSLCAVVLSKHLFLLIYLQLVCWDYFPSIDPFAFTLCPSWYVIRPLLCQSVLTLITLEVVRTTISQSLIYSKVNTTISFYQTVGTIVWAMRTTDLFFCAFVPQMVCHLRFIIWLTQTNSHIAGTPF